MAVAASDLAAVPGAGGEAGMHQAIPQTPIADTDDFMDAAMAMNGAIEELRNQAVALGVGVQA